VIAAACRFCKTGSEVSQSIKFEEKYPVHDGFKKHPNIDVVIHNRAGSKFKRFAIECKFSEAYQGRQRHGLKAKYLDLDNLWAGLSNLRELAVEISPDDRRFQHLHPAQLIKHTLGLRRQFGSRGFRLAYLWYDVPGADGHRHRQEIELYAKTARADGLYFHALSYQELIATLVTKQHVEHSEYINYMSDRYL
jgi:hypothetical protein